MRHRPDLNIEKLLFSEEKLTFLVGAGCSVDRPSCLPDGHSMMKAIINYSCANLEKARIVELMTSGKLRFEQLVEVFRDRLDKDLKIINLYGESKHPNIQHFFLADMIKRGHFVMTTNFDFLIEYALLESNVSKDEIIPVITKEDFDEYNDPNKLFEQRKKAVYKVHGSLENLITQEDTRKSLVATIRAFGSNKAGISVFQVEPFKKDLFENISKNRSLVTLGYSGSDDFDIVPTLKVLKDLKKVIWVNHEKDNDGNEKIYEIREENIETLDKVNQILMEIKTNNNIDHLYRVDVNTTKMINKLLRSSPQLSLSNFSITPMNWLETNIEIPNEMTKYEIAYQIYRNFDMFNDALRCLEEIVRIANNSDQRNWKVKAFNRIGDIYRKQGKLVNALKFLKDSLELNKITGDLAEKSMSLHFIGTVLKLQGKIQESLTFFEESYKIDTQLGDLDGQASSLNHIGSILREEGKSDNAMILHEQALRKFETTGDLDGKAITLYYIGLTLMYQEKYTEALEKLKELLKIDEQLGKIEGTADIFGWIGDIYKIQGKFDKALKYYKQAIEVTEQSGQESDSRILSNKASNLASIGVIYKGQNNYREANKKFEEAIQTNEKALQIAEKQENLIIKGSCLNKLGGLYSDLMQFNNAEDYYRKALKVYEKMAENNPEVYKPYVKHTQNNLNYVYFHKQLED